MALTVLRIVEHFKTRKDRVEHHNRMSSNVKLHKKVAPPTCGRVLVVLRCSTCVCGVYLLLKGLPSKTGLGYDGKIIKRLK